MVAKVLLSSCLCLLGGYQGISRVFKVGYQSVARWLPGCSGWFQCVAGGLLGLYGWFLERSLVVCLGVLGDL